MRYVALALILGLGLVWLGFYAAGSDGYHGSAEVSRWDHAANWGTTPIVIGAAAIASAVALAFLARGLFLRRPAIGPLAIAGVGVYCLSIAVGWFFLTAGH